MFRPDGIRIVLKHIGSLPIVSNLGPTSHELWHIGDRARNFYTYGAMGLCSSIALGMALSIEEKVISLDGDGSVLMNMGGMATIGSKHPGNLIVIVFDNEEWGQVGHHPSHTSENTDLERVAQACGVSNTSTVTTEEELEKSLKSALQSEGPCLIVAKVKEGGYGPPCPNEPEMTLYRFRQTFLS